MHRTALFFAGLMFTAILVFLPLAFVTQWSGQAPSLIVLVCAVVPLFILGLTMIWPRPWMLLGVFPLAHLPVIASQPDLVGSVVYAGSTGVLAFMMLALTASAWVSLAGRLTHPTPMTASRGRRAYAAGVYLIASAIFAAFVVPIFETLGADNARITVVIIAIALLVTLTVAGRWLMVELGEFLHEPAVRRRWIVTQVRAQRPHPNQWKLSMIMATVTASLVVILFR